MHQIQFNIESWSKSCEKMVEGHELFPHNGLEDDAKKLLMEIDVMTSSSPSPFDIITEMSLRVAGACNYHTITAMF